MLEKSGFSGIRAVSGFSSETASEEDTVFCIIGLREKEL
jgi:hypothetical protein